MRFWDWDFGWAASLHDYTLFVNSVEGRATMRGDYLPYKLIGDAAYPFARACTFPSRELKKRWSQLKNIGISFGVRSVEGKVENFVETQ